MGKERYFGSKAVLKGRTFHPKVRSLDVVKKTKDENCMLTSIYTQGWVTARPMKVLKGEMTPFHKMMYKLVH
ncbi:hypothetical protein KY285_011075 [Solanum tuberosum]|nr:hypothetical protein KY289_011630 [Solanum tuberosum]KAH0735368.1 hypothetical protein KY285_011075 [Solanum tuberosum]